jgi:hypothetical protein
MKTARSPCLPPTLRCERACAAWVRASQPSPLPLPRPIPSAGHVSALAVPEPRAARRRAQPRSQLSCRRVLTRAPRRRRSALSPTRAYNPPGGNARGGAIVSAVVAAPRCSAAALQLRALFRPRSTASAANSARAAVTHARAVPSAERRFRGQFPRVAVTHARAVPSAERRFRGQFLRGSR